MFPQFSIGTLAISSFGVALMLGFLVGIFLVWRLSRAWDLDEEKVLDLTFLTFLGGLLGSRIYFALENISKFSQNPLSIIFFNKLPGFSLWGGVLGGFLTLYFFSKRKRLDFWMALDISGVGLIAGLIFSSLGCFLTGCDIGISSRLFFAVNMVGEIGRRFPVQILESFLLLILLLKLWSQSIHFHQRGKIFGLSLIYIGLIKLIMEPLKASHDEGIFLSAVLVILGLNIFYRVTKRSLKVDLKSFAVFLKMLLTDFQVRKVTMERLGKYWYNQKTSISWNIRNLKKNLRRINVKVSYKNH